MDFLLSLLKSVGLFIILMCFTMYFCVNAIDKTAAEMREYEVAHNCRYDYNDMCYTKSERPWLFE